MLVVSDTSPLRALACIGKLDLLKILFDKVLIPEAVSLELRSAQNRGLDLVDIFVVEWIEVVPVSPSSKLTQFKKELDPGEAEAIALALEVNTDFILMDEKMGRAAAEREGLKIIGVLGVLVRAKSERLIPEVRPLMDQLRSEAEFWVADNTYRMILDFAGE